MRGTVRPGRGLSGTELKWIAMGSMVIDHVGATLVRNPSLYYICRLAGRLAMPLFVFLLVEGFCHTRDVRKYGARLLLLAFLSEIPFDLAFHGCVLEFSGQNVFFTLFLGLGMMVCVRQCEERGSAWGGRGGQAAQAAVLAVFCVAAVAIRCDYHAYGIVMIALCYLLRSDNRLRLTALGLLNGVMTLAFFGSAALAVIPMGLYNGTRGKGSGRWFYLIYPGHLLILAALARVLSVMM